MEVASFTQSSQPKFFLLVGLTLASANLAKNCLILPVGSHLRHLSPQIAIPTIPSGIHASLSQVPPPLASPTTRAFWPLLYIILYIHRTVTLRTA